MGQIRQILRYLFLSMKQTLLKAKIIMLPKKKALLQLF